MHAELVKRAAHFFRLGQAAMASVSLQSYLRHPDRVPHARDEELIRSVHSADYLWCADILTESIAPLYA